MPPRHPAQHAARRSVSAVPAFPRKALVKRGRSRPASDSPRGGAAGRHRALAASSGSPRGDAVHDSPACAGATTSAEPNARRGASPAGPDHRLPNSARVGQFRAVPKHREHDGSSRALAGERRRRDVFRSRPVTDSLGANALAAGSQRPGNADRLTLHRLRLIERLQAGAEQQRGPAPRQPGSGARPSGETRLVRDLACFAGAQ